MVLRSSARLWQIPQEIICFTQFIQLYDTIHFSNQIKGTKMSRVMDFMVTGRWVKKTPKHKLFFVARVGSAHDMFIPICYSSGVEHISHHNWPGSKLRF